MRDLSIDIETYSDIDLTKCGVHKYIDSSKFKLLLFAYSVDFGKVEIVDVIKGFRIPPYIIEALFDEKVTKHAFNAQFERLALSKYLNCKLPAIQWSCTMVHAYMVGLSGGLKEVGKALCIEENKLKLTIGSKLIKKFSIEGSSPYCSKEDWELFKEYCIQDVVAEIEIYRKLMEILEFKKSERILYALDQCINDRGIPVDVEFVKQAIEIDKLNKNQLLDEIYDLTKLDNPNSPAQLKSWISTMEGIEVISLNKASLSNMEFENPIVKRVLEIRGELSKTSLKKYSTLLDYEHKGRIFGQIQFYGAGRTGRFAGRGIQVHNLPQNHIETLDNAMGIVLSNMEVSMKIQLLKCLYGSVSNVLSELIRTSIKAGTGKTFVVADFSAIEARVIAWLAKETWRNKVFATHGKIYEASASEMFKVDIEEVTKGSTLREKGKIAELALGYGGSVGALKSMGALKMGLKEEELKPLVTTFRYANKNITSLWAKVEKAVINVIKGEAFEYVNHLDFMFNNGNLYIKLPSGRFLVYFNPRIIIGKFGKEVLEYGENSKRVDTFGGKLVENIVQAISRDLLTVSLYKLKEMDICFHVHDEIVIETFVEDSEDVKNKVLAVMKEPVQWAEGLILDGSMFITNYYKK